MPTPTPVLGLQRAVATDLDPTYLTVDLAASLATLDGLFDPVAGHTHFGAGQGGSIMPLQEHVTFAAENTYDIGTGGGNRPRDMFLASHLSINSGPQTWALHVQGDAYMSHLGIGDGPRSDKGIHCNAPAQIFGPLGVGADAIESVGIRMLVTLKGDNPTGIDCTPIFDITTTGQITGLEMGLGSQDGGYTGTNGIANLIKTPDYRTGWTMVTNYGLKIENQGHANVTNSWGIHVAPQSNSTAGNVGIYNGGTYDQEVQLATPTLLPAAGSMRLYPKADGFYQQDSAGVETPLFGGGSAPAAGPIDNPDWIRVTGYPTPMPTTGAGVEMLGDAAGGILQAYDRATGANLPLNLTGSAINLNGAVATSNNLSVGMGSAGILSVGSGIFLGTGPTANLVWGGAAAPDTVDVMSNLRIQGGNIKFGATNASIFDAGIDDPFTAGQRLVGINALTISPGSLHTAGATINGNASISGFASVTGTLTVTGGGAFGPGITVNTGRQTNAGSIMLYAGVGAANDVQLFAENGSLYVWYANPAGGMMHQATAGAGWTPITASAFTVASTSSIKTDLVPLEAPTALGQVLDPRVTPTAFTDTNGARQVGFIAEEMVEVVPEVVSLDDQGAPQGIHYGALVSVLWSAMRDLANRLSALEQPVGAPRTPTPTVRRRGVTA